MIGMWIGGRLLCGLAVRHRHRVMVVVPFHRVLRMLCVYCVIHGCHRRSGSHVTMRQPAAHQRGEQHQQHGKPSQGLEPAVEDRMTHPAILRACAQPWTPFRFCPYDTVTQELASRGDM